MRKFSCYAGEVHGAMHLVPAVTSDDDGKLLEIVLAQVNTFGEVGDRYEIRDSEGNVIHRIDVTLIYSVRPGEDEKNE